MDAVFSNFDEYLKAFGLTIGLFVVSGLASMVLGTSWPPSGSARSRSCARRPRST